jgi:hypothetical protein
MYIMFLLTKSHNSEKFFFLPQHNTAEMLDGASSFFAFSDIFLDTHIYTAAGA